MPGTPGEVPNPDDPTDVAAFANIPGGIGAAGKFELVVPAEPYEVVGFGINVPVGIGGGMGGAAPKNEGGIGGFCATFTVGCCVCAAFTDAVTLFEGSAGKVVGTDCGGKDGAEKF